MAKPRKQIIGKIPCPLCGTDCVVKADEGDQAKTLNYVCHMGCDSPNYAQAGTRAHDLVLKKMKPLADAAPAPAPKPAVQPAPVPTPAPAAAPKKAGFFA